MGQNLHVKLEELYAELVTEINHMGNYVYVGDNNTLKRFSIWKEIDGFLNNKITLQ